MHSKQTSAIDSDSLSAGLALLDDIPPLDNTVQRLIQALSNDDISEKQLASIIDQCPSLSGKIVGLANSAYFRRNTPIQNLQDAIRLIGLRTVKSFAIASTLQDPFSNSQCPSFRPGHYWLHDVLTAHVARELSRQLPSHHAMHPEQAYLAGLLHNIGLLALAYLYPDDLNNILQEEVANSEILAKKTLYTFGADYLTVGAALLKYWHLPESFVAMAKNYANPGYQGNDWPLCRLINVAREWANHIVHQQTSAPFNANGLAQLGISTNAAETTRIKCLEQLEVYTELCEIISGSKAEFYNRDTVNQAAVELKARLDDSIDSLSSIRALTDLNIRNKSEKELLNDALKILMEHQDMQRCSIFLNKESALVNASGLSWDEHFTKNDQPSSNATYTFSLGEGIIGMVAETGEMKHAPDTSVEPLFKQIATENKYVPGSLICVPICFQEASLGVLNISHSKPHIFTEWHERFLLVYANMLGQLLAYSRTIRDMDATISQRTKELQFALARAETLSTCDELTGIHNRRYFINHFDKMIEQSARYGDHISVLMVDIDNFKTINDTYGHLEGDRTLVKVAHAIAHCARDADIFARLGGEEFIIALQHADCEKSQIVANRILTTISELQCGDKEKYSITASIGLSCCNPSGKIVKKSSEQWIREADKALYQAKHSGKNRTAIYTATDH